VSSFFERNRAELERQGIDPDRLPPGQYFTERFPVLHVGDVPETDLATWDLQLFGAVREDHRLSWDELHALPVSDVVCDIHCVTKWSKLDTRWRGVRFEDVMNVVDVDRASDTVVAHAEHGYSANMPLAVLLGEDALLAWEHDGEPLPPEHGGPLRLVVPRLYFWKSAKWLRGLEWRVGDDPGFWERNGYHNEGDPWREQRYWGD
jgi:DMSO/TMAO reductase YedYZ molybdopterin-dependent catalytic subunit